MDLKEKFIAFLSVLKKIKSMCEIKGGHKKILIIYLLIDYGSTIVLPAQRSIYSMF